MREGVTAAEAFLERDGLQCMIRISENIALSIWETNQIRNALEVET